MWIDILAPNIETLEPLQELFGLHPLAVEDALHAHQRPKVEPYAGFWFVVAHHATLAAHNRLLVHETALFIGERFVISAHYDDTFEYSELLRRYQTVPLSWRRSSSSLVYVLLDYLVDTFSPLIDTLESDLRRVRLYLASGRAAKPEILRRIFVLEELSHEAHAVALGLRDILPPFINAPVDAPIHGGADAAYYRDIHDHATSAVERLHNERHLSQRAFDIYQSLASQQQTQVARQLTIVSTIFLPLTFLTGFFGQNFDFLVKNVASERAFLLFGVGSYVLSLIAILLVIRHVSSGQELPIS